MASRSKQQIFYSEIFNSEMVKYYRTHIIEFVYDIIFQNNKEDFLSEQQKELLLAIQDNKRVSAKSGKGVGKTATISFAIIWFLCCFDEPKIVATSPSFSNLNSALWPEVNLWLNKSLVKHIFTHTSTRLYLTEAPKNWWAEPRTAREKESLQGLHSNNLMVIGDEASAIPIDIHEALDTTLTGRNNKYIMISNPTRVTGPFFDTFGRFANKWKNLTLNAEESPFVKKEQIDYFLEKYGKNSDIYKVSVLGEFPSGSPDSFLKLSDINAAVERWEYAVSEGPVEVGIDVARFGDDSTVLYWRRGYKVYPPKTLEKNTIPEAAQLVIDTVKEIRLSTGYDKKIRVKVDATGLGAGVCDILKLDRENNIEVVECNNGGKGDDKYHNEVSCMWGHFRDIINLVGLPKDSNTIEELSARKWRLSQSGKTLIEPKSEFKKLYKASPDRADALMLCFYNKANEKTVVKNFDPLDQSLVKDNVSYIGENRYGSVFYSRDLTTSIVYGAWDGGRLYVYDELQCDDSLIYVVSNVLSHGNLTRIIGNDKMFSVKGDDLASKFRKYRVNIYENFYFNELTAIETLNNLITQKRLIVNSNCKKLIEQLQIWKMENSKFDMENTYGLCYSLLYLISELKTKIENKDRSSLLVTSYGQTNSLNLNISNSWMSI